MAAKKTETIEKKKAKVVNIKLVRDKKKAEESKGSFFTLKRVLVAAGVIVVGTVIGILASGTSE